MFVIGHFHGNPVSSRRESLNDPFKPLQVFAIHIDMNMVAFCAFSQGKFRREIRSYDFPVFRESYGHT